MFIRHIFICFFCMILSQVYGDTSIAFTPPDGWKQVTAAELPASIKAMVIGKGKSHLSPSISLAIEESNKTLDEYLKIVKNINASKGAQWKNLGKFKTPAGEGNLSQADTVTEWGELRMMHVILAKDGHIYIMTAAALKDEFPEFQPTFFKTMKSLHYQ